MSPREAGFLPALHAIEAYGLGGFRFASMSHRGSILALPSGIRAWAADSPQDVTCAALAPLFEEPAGAVTLLLVGMGARAAPLAPEVRAALRRASISVEALATGQAVSTYNILIGEGRRAAAALLAAP